VKPELTRCSECDTLHVVAAADAATGRLFARCVHCEREWPVEPGDLPRAAALRCRDHPGRPATSLCERCRDGFCAACIPLQRLQGVEMRLSPCCRAVGIPRVTAFVVEPPWKQPLELLSYPLQRKGWGVFLAILIALQIPVISLLFVLLLSGYLARVLIASASGQRHLPEFPEFVSAWDAVFFPTARLLASGWLAFLPLWLYLKRHDHEWSDPVVPALWLLGLLFTPMIVMHATLAQSMMEALNPARALRFIVAMGTDYLATVGMLVLVWAIYLPVRPDLRDSWLGGWADAAVDLYVLFLSFHILGRAAYATRDRVDWGV
jgi:hypothetical protein